MTVVLNHGCEVYRTGSLMVQSNELQATAIHWWAPRVDAVTADAP